MRMSSVGLLCHVVRGNHPGGARRYSVSSRVIVRFVTQHAMSNALACCNRASEAHTGAALRHCFARLRADLHGEVAFSNGRMLPDCLHVEYGRERMAKKVRPDPRAASVVDREIGARIRARRLDIGMSQIKLGQAIGVTFQQIQKYEKGVNRVSASTLIDVSQALESNPGDFLPSLQTRPGAAWEGDDPDARAIARIYSRLRPEAKRMLTKVARSLLSDYESKDKDRR